MKLFEKIWAFIINDNQKWMKLTELCPYCNNYFEKKDIKKHINICLKIKSEK